MRAKEMQRANEMQRAKERFGVRRKGRRPKSETKQKVGRGRGEQNNVEKGGSKKGERLAQVHQ